MKACSWHLPSDSALGELQCVREHLHEGKHYVYIMFNETKLELFAVDDPLRSLKCVCRCDVHGPVTRDAVIALVDHLMSVTEFMYGKYDDHIELVP